jgi:putative spermidine/putrescine transport system permease protein
VGLSGMRVLIVIAIVIGGFIAAPMFIVVPMSFSDAQSFQFPPPGYWLGYYERYFTDYNWTVPTVNSFVIATATMVLTMVLVIPAAFGLVRNRFFGRALANYLLMAPLMVPHIVIALAYYLFFGPLHLTGTHLGVILAHTCLSVPVAFLIVSATLKGFDRNLERAAMSLGAGPVATFVHVTLPVLRPGFLVGALFAFLHSFDETTVAIFIAGRDAATLPRKMFEAIRLEADPVIAVVSTLLLGIVLACTVIAAYMRERKESARAN